MRLINFFGGVAMNRKNSFVFLLLLAGLFMVSGCLCQADAPAGGNDFDHAREVIFSAYGDTAAWFEPQNLPDHISLWSGQKRLILRK